MFDKGHHEAGIARETRLCGAQSSQQSGSGARVRPGQAGPGHELNVNRHGLCSLRGASAQPLPLGGMLGTPAPACLAIFRRTLRRQPGTFHPTLHFASSDEDPAQSPPQGKAPQHQDTAWSLLGFRSPSQSPLCGSSALEPHPQGPSALFHPSPLLAAAPTPWHSHYWSVETSEPWLEGPAGHLKQKLQTKG